MDNIVGSQIRINKYWTTKWSLFKKDLSLNQRQRSLIIGSLLGDGTLRIGEGAVNANFKVEHGLQQKDLVFWKYEILKSWVSTEPKISYRYDPNGNKYAKSWWFRTIRHPELLKLRNKFYKDGIKIIPNDIVKLMDNFAVACWIMDDGSYSRSAIDISTYSFSLGDIYKIIELFSKKFGVVAKYFRDRDKGYRMYFSVSETKKVIEFIKPYIIPSMEYKIGYSNFDPVKTSFIEERYNF